MAFTWFDKFTKAARAIPDRAKRAEFIMGLAEYGTDGTEPEFEDWTLQALFESVREDIENSISMRERGSRGGRPKAKKEPAEEVEEAAETEEKTTEETSAKQVKTTSETGLNQFSDPLKPNPIQTKPNQTNPNQTKGRGAFAPPTPAEVKAYADEKGLTLDAERFVDTFAAQGWRLSNGNPMRDWQAAVRTWVARDAKWAAERGGKPQAVDDERRRRWDERYGGLE